MKADFIFVQSLPIYSILLALNRTTVDYFSLDVVGLELDILKTIPWSKVNIRVICFNSFNYANDESGDLVRLWPSTSLTSKRERKPWRTTCSCKAIAWKAKYSKVAPRWPTTWSSLNVFNPFLFCIFGQSQIIGLYEFIRKCTKEFSQCEQCCHSLLLRLNFFRVPIKYIRHGALSDELGDLLQTFMGRKNLALGLFDAICRPDFYVLQVSLTRWR